jgi:hypothetical protein
VQKLSLAGSLVGSALIFMNGHYIVGDGGGGGVEMNNNNKKTEVEHRLFVN